MGVKINTVEHLLERQRSISGLKSKHVVDETRLREYLEDYLPRFWKEDLHTLGYLLLGILNSPFLGWDLEEDSWVVAESLLPRDRNEVAQLELARLWATQLTSNSSMQVIHGIDELWGLNGYPLLSLSDVRDRESASHSSVDELLKVGFELFNADEGSPKDPRSWHQNIWELRTHFVGSKALSRHEFVVRAILEQPKDQHEILVSYLIHGLSNDELALEFGVTEFELKDLKYSVKCSVKRLAFEEQENRESLPKRQKLSSRDVIAETQYDPYQDT